MTVPRAYSLAATFGVCMISALSFRTAAAASPQADEATAAQETRDSTGDELPAIAHARMDVRLNYEQYEVGKPPVVAQVDVPFFQSMAGEWSVSGLLTASGAEHRCVMQRISSNGAPFGYAVEWAPSSSAGAGTVTSGAKMSGFMLLLSTGPDGASARIRIRLDRLATAEVTARLKDGVLRIPLLQDTETLVRTDAALQDANALTLQEAGRDTVVSVNLQGSKAAAVALHRCVEQGVRLHERR